MKEKIKIYVILTLIIGALFGGFLVWRSYQKIERQYQACLEKCEAEHPYWLEGPFGQVCIAECKEKYAK